MEFYDCESENELETASKDENNFSVIAHSLKDPCAFYQELKEMVTTTEQLLATFDRNYEKCQQNTKLFTSEEDDDSNCSAKTILFEMNLGLPAAVATGTTRAAAVHQQSSSHVNFQASMSNGNMYYNIPATQRFAIESKEYVGAENYGQPCFCRSRMQSKRAGDNKTLPYTLTQTTDSPKTISYDGCKAGNSVYNKINAVYTSLPASSEYYPNNCCNYNFNDGKHHPEVQFFSPQAPQLHPPYPQSPQTEHKQRAKIDSLFTRTTYRLLGIGKRFISTISNIISLVVDDNDMVSSPRDGYQAKRISSGAAVPVCNCNCDCEQNEEPSYEEQGNEQDPNPQQPYQQLYPQLVNQHEIYDHQLFEQQPLEQHPSEQYTWEQQSYQPQQYQQEQYQQQPPLQMIDLSKYQSNMSTQTDDQPEYQSRSLLMYVPTHQQPPSQCLCELPTFEQEIPLEQASEEMQVACENQQEQQEPKVEEQQEHEKCYEVTYPNCCTPTGVVCCEENNIIEPVISSAISVLNAINETNEPTISPAASVLNTINETTEPIFENLNQNDEIEENNCQCKSPSLVASEITLTPEKSLTPEPPIISCGRKESENRILCENITPAELKEAPLKTGLKSDDKAIKPCHCGNKGTVLIKPPCECGADGALNEDCKLPACYENSTTCNCSCSVPGALVRCCRQAIDEKCICHNYNLPKLYRLALPQHKDLDLCIPCRFDPSPLLDDEGNVFCPGKCGCCLCPWRTRATISKQNLLLHEKVRVCNCRERGTIFNLKPGDSRCSTVGTFDLCPCLERAEQKFLELYNQEMWSVEDKELNKLSGPAVTLKDIVEIRPISTKKPKRHK